ncbi:lipoyl(octanoyl) transferase LipB [Methylobacillus gramineus]|uniref:lipoyl(octanoyl) transferase LipB n=1 Tax=Methylobacillus gramineus TaxID=755169 RepID=UPI001CFF8AA3|nr:lipoyl(octanoyl) transferase LipB [Methylobacillus gramineus]MCB5185968.1 lipoyl(octanoyl) transferase LipB [Methylobacillus gramineus]
MSPSLIIRHLGRSDYAATWHAMQAFTASRHGQTPDEIWLTEHAPVYTLGLNRKDVRLPTRSDIPLVPVDRGGKITYHGPGQVVIYLLIDLKRQGINVRQLVSAMENAIIALLAEEGVIALARADAPGVYVQGAKIASLGLRLKNQCSYHGLALNIDMDITPFLAIDPCGYQGLQVTQTINLGLRLTLASAGERLLEKLSQQLGYTDCLHEKNL